MRVSQLIHVIDKDEMIVIHDFDKPIDKMKIYTGAVRGITKDNPINKMHVTCITATDDTIFIVAETPRKKGGG